MTSNCPIPATRLRQISNDACDSALANVSGYVHAETQEWNQAIIQKILQAIISESANVDSEKKFKYVVNSTIIQHLTDPRSEGNTQLGSPESVSLGSDAVKKVGRRGMNSSSGAFWNQASDGIWSYKYTGAEGKGMDTVISVMWISA